MKKAVRLVAHGRVQGVGFRWFVYNEATKLNINGYVKNLPNGDVEVFAEGEKQDVDQLITQVGKGPAFSRVLDLLTEPHNYQDRYQKFEITY
jgi:acylphosphatase